jgi:hypothetical protein
MCVEMGLEIEMKRHHCEPYTLLSFVQKNPKCLALS